MKKYLVISGIDGIGETSVINSLKEELERQVHSTQYIWMRINHYYVKVMNALARVLKPSVPIHIDFSDVWEYRLYKSPLFCKIDVWYSYIDNRIARRKALRLDADFIICNRWVTLVDLGAECRIPEILGSKWYGHFQKILSKNTEQYVIVGGRKGIVDCRLENRTNPDFPYRMDLYQKYQQKAEVHVIDKIGTIKESVEQI